MLYNTVTESIHRSVDYSKDSFGLYKVFLCHVKGEEKQHLLVHLSSLHIIMLKQSQHRGIHDEPILMA